jgi:hypothetical protein
MKGYTIYKELKEEIEKVVAGGDAHKCNDLANKEYVEK